MRAIFSIKSEGKLLITDGLDIISKFESDIFDKGYIRKIFSIILKIFQARKKKKKKFSDESFRK